MLVLSWMDSFWRKALLHTLPTADASEEKTHVIYVHVCLSRRKETAQHVLISIYSQVDFADQQILQTCMCIVCQGHWIHDWQYIDHLSKQELTFLCLLGGHTATAQCWNDKNFVLLFSCLFHEEADRQWSYSLCSVCFSGASCILCMAISEYYSLQIEPHTLTLPWSNSWSDELCKWAC